jgi:DNA-binding response OmpR family regulator
LVVDRNELTARSLARYLSDEFDAVEVADGHERAQAVFDDATRAPTHLVCGQNFGPNQTCGIEMVRKWREQTPSLERVVLATDPAQVPNDLNGVDWLCLKPLDPERLVALLDVVRRD